MKLSARKKMLLKHYRRKIARIFGLVSSREREKDFILENIDHGNSKKILDIGCEGSILPEEMSGKGHFVVGLDVQSYGEAKGFTFIQGDLIKDDLPLEAGSFDYITCLSTIEHIGIGYYGDGVNQSGDRIAIEKMRALLKDDGKLLVTIPFSDVYREDSFQRIHTYESFSKLIDGLFEIELECYWIPAFRKHWVSASRTEAQKLHKASSQSNNACFVLGKII